MLQRFWLYFVVVEEIHFEADERRAWQGNTCSARHLLLLHHDARTSSFQLSSHRFDSPTGICI